MEKQGLSQNGGKKLFKCCNHSWGFVLIKIFLAILLVFLLLVVGMGFGAKLNRVGQYGRGFGMMGISGQNFGGGSCLSGGSAQRGPGMMGRFLNDDQGQGWGEKIQSVSRVFGTITKIEGNKITVLNNAAVEQIVVSLAETVIVSSTDEISLSALKVGGNIIAIGSTNADNRFEATMIKAL